MKSEFKNLLPKSARALVDDIERFCGFEIQVLPNPHPVSKTDPNPTGPASMIDEKSVTVFYRGRHNLIGSGLLHEILHLHRYSVEKIPQIMPTSNEESHWAITGQIENSLEHIVIISREADHGFDPYEHWNNTSRSNWSHDPWSNLDPWAKRKKALLGWLSIKFIVTDGEVKRLAKNAIKKEGMLDIVNEYASLIEANITAKENTLAITVAYLQIPIEQVKLVWFDFDKKRRVEKPMPTYKISE